MSMGCRLPDLHSAEGEQVNTPPVIKMPIERDEWEKLASQAQPTLLRER